MTLLRYNFWLSCLIYVLYIVQDNSCLIYVLYIVHVYVLYIVHVYVLYIVQDNRIQGKLEIETENQPNLIDLYK